MRGTGGNRFIPTDATRVDLLNAILDVLQSLEIYAGLGNRSLDLGAITVETKRIRDGRISVDVTADLKVES